MHKSPWCVRLTIVGLTKCGNLKARTVTSIFNEGIQVLHIPNLTPSAFCVEHLLLVMSTAWLED
jgi:hypothetical protein